MKLEFLSADFRKTRIYQVLIKIQPVGAELFDVDRWSDMTANGRFSQFCETAMSGFTMNYMNLLHTPIT